jgi:hypothetical protein
MQWTFPASAALLEHRGWSDPGRITPARSAKAKAVACPAHLADTAGSLVVGVRGYPWGGRMPGTQMMA